MTWKELADYINLEIRRTPKVANMDALVWICEPQSLTEGEYEITSVSPYDFSQRITEQNKLSINLKQQ